MKYFKRACAFLVAFITTLCLFACGSKAELSSFNVAEKDTAFLGDTYTILEVVAKDTDGKEYLPTVAVTCEGEEVVVTNNAFNVEKLSDYIISYTVNFNKKDIVKTTTVEVKDNLAPTINVGAYKESVALNDVVNLPEVKASDNSGETITPTIKVYYKDSKEEVAVADNKFTAAKAGYYTIAIEAKDKTGNPTNKNLCVVVRAKNEIESFDSKSFVSTVGNIGTPNGALISYNDDPNYVLQGEGSLKIKTSESQVKGTYPEVKIVKPAIKDITKFYSMSFAVYNATPYSTSINVANRTDGWFALNPFTWTRVEITSEHYSDILSGKDFNNNPTAGAQNLEGLRLYFEKTVDEEMVFYMDDIRVHTEAMPDAIGEINNTDSILADEELTVKTFAAAEHITTRLLNLQTGERTLIDPANNKIKIAKVGRYSIEYIYQNGNDNQVYYDDFTVRTVDKKPALTIENFENHPDLYYGCNGQTTMTISDEHVIDGLQSLKFEFNVNDGYPSVYGAKADFAKYFDLFDYVTIRIFNAGSKNHNINCNDFELPMLKPGLNEIVLTNEKFKEIVNNDEKAATVDKVYQPGRVTFFIFNVGDQNEAYSIYLDSFTGGYNDLACKSEVPFDFEAAFEGYTFESIKATLGETVLTAADGKITFTKPGTYDVELKGNRVDSLVDTIKVKIVVSDSNKPEITLGAHKSTVPLNGEYTLPEVTITDNIDTNLKATWKVFFKDTTEEITVADNKFTATKLGYYRVVCTTKDSSNNETSVEYIVRTRNDNEIEAFEDEEFVNNPENFLAKNGATLVFNNEPLYVLQGNGSLKFTSAEVKGSWPEMVINYPGITNIKDRYGLSFAVYNNTSAVLSVNVANAQKGWFKLQPYAWTIVTITKDRYEEILSGKDFQGNPTAGAEDLSGLRLYFEKTIDGTMELYFDDFKVLDKACDDVIGSIDNLNKVLSGKEFEVQLSANANVTTYLVNNATGERTKITAENKMQTLTGSGNYKIEYIYQEGNKNQVAYDEFVVFEIVAKKALTIEDFENNPDVFYSCNSQTTMSISNEHVIDGEQSLRYDISQWDGYPSVSADKEQLLQYADIYDYVVFNIYNAGSKSHSIHLNDYTLKALAPGLNQYKMTNADFKKYLNADEAAHGVDNNIYGLGRLTFFLENTGDQNELFSIFFDSFVGGYNDIDAVAGKEFNFTEKFPGYTFTSIVATKGEEVINAADGKLTFTQGGTYELVLTGKRADTLEDVIKLKANVVDLNKPEITLGEHLDKVDMGSEYVLPTVTITDNIDTDLKPTFKVYFGSDEVAVANNKFIAANEGTYRVVVSTVDTSGNEASVEFTVTVVKPYAKDALTVEDFESNPLAYYTCKSSMNMELSAEHVLDGKQSLKINIPDWEAYIYFRVEKAKLAEYIDLYDSVVLNMFSTGNNTHKMWANDVRLPDLVPGANRIVLSNDVFKKIVNNDEGAYNYDNNTYAMGMVTFFINAEAPLNEAMSIYLDSFVGDFTLRAEINKEFDLAAALPGYTISSVKATMGETVVDGTGSKLTFTVPGEYTLAITGKRVGTAEATFQLKVVAMNLAVDFEDAADLNQYVVEQATPEIVEGAGTYGASGMRMSNTGGWPQFGLKESILQSGLDGMDYLEFDLRVDTTFATRTIEVKFYTGGWGDNGITVGSLTANTWHTVSVPKAVIEDQAAKGKLQLWVVVGNPDGDRDVNLTISIDAVRYTNNACGDVRF